MKIAIMADIHSNLYALETALEIIKKDEVDRIFICGDVVGYGKQPNECCEVVRSMGCPVVAGNHDHAVADLIEYKTSHSTSAINGIEYAKSVITPENLEWLRSLPLYHIENDMEFVHASIINPDRWCYLALGKPFDDSKYQDVRDIFSAMKSQVCFVGHSHIPSIFIEKRVKNIAVIDTSKHSYELAGKRAVIDVGSVGKPRTSAKRASLVIYDNEPQLVWFKRFRAVRN